MRQTELTITEATIKIVFESDELITDERFEEALDEVVRLIKKGYYGGQQHGEICEWSLETEEEDIDIWIDEYGNPQVLGDY